jgi:hypothetical protein
MRNLTNVAGRLLKGIVCVRGYEQTRMSTTFRDPSAGQRGLRQSQFSDDLMIQRPKRGVPVSVLHGQALGMSANTQASETGEHANL